MALFRFPHETLDLRPQNVLPNLDEFRTCRGFVVLQDLACLGQLETLIDGPCHVREETRNYLIVFLEADKLANKNAF